MASHKEDGEEEKECRKGPSLQESVDYLTAMSGTVSLEEQESMGFTFDEAIVTLRFLKKIRDNPMLLSNEHLINTQLPFLINPKRTTQSERAMWRDLHKRITEEARKADQKVLQLSALHQSRDSAMELLMDVGCGHDFTNKVVCNSQRVKRLTECKLSEEEKKKVIMEGNEVIVEEVDEQEEKASEERKTLGGTQYAQKCYICKARYFDIHNFYFQLCPACAELNWAKRSALFADTKSLVGRNVLLTGSRIKIGRAICISLLKMGATVIATTRFPFDMHLRYSKEEGYTQWKDRLHIYRVDLRNLALVNSFCAYLRSKYNSLYAIINNAAQTVARPQEYYAHLLSQEEESIRKDLITDGKTNDWYNYIQEISKPKDKVNLLLGESNRTEYTSSGDGKQVITNFSYDNTKIDHDTYDTMQVSLDLRKSNSWVESLENISGIEAAEVHFINALAPFIINSSLKPLLCVPQPELDRDPSVTIKNKAVPIKRFIINVSAMEGQFYRFKTACHPHTNMAKASLNMLTRTSAQGYALEGIFMNSVDTGWITDENPIDKAKERHAGGMLCPIDEWDAAARVLDTVVMGSTMFGKFLKDYVEIPW